jgi:hypothetical protein
MIRILEAKFRRYFRFLIRKNSALTNSWCFLSSDCIDLKFIFVIVLRLNYFFSVYLLQIIDFPLEVEELKILFYSTMIFFTPRSVYSSICWICVFHFKLTIKRCLLKLFYNIFNVIKFVWTIWANWNICILNHFNVYCIFL